MEAKGHEETEAGTDEWTYRPPTTDQDIRVIYHEMARLIEGRFNHSSDEMREAARRIIQPIIRLAAGYPGPEIVSPYQLTTIGKAIADYLYFAELDLPQRAFESIIDAAGSVETLAFRASHTAGFLAEEVLSQHRKVPGPDDGRNKAEL